MSAQQTSMTIGNTYHGHQDPFYCKCVFCKKFWSNTFGPLKNFASSAPLDRSIATSSLFRQKGIIKVGDRVVVDGEHKGVVKFVGLLHDDQLAPKTWVGVKLDDNVNATNGTFNNKVYFSCPNGHGIMVPYTVVRQLNPPEKRPALTGNEMFPSYETVKANRKIRLALEEELAAVKSSGKIPEMFKPQTPPPDDNASVSSRPTTAVSSRTRGGTSSFVFTSSKKSSVVLYRFRQRNEHQRMEQLKIEFGGGERGDTLIKTLQKLQLAYDRGRELIGQQHNSNNSLTLI